MSFVMIGRLLQQQIRSPYDKKRCFQFSYSKFTKIHQDFCGRRNLCFYQNQNTKVKCFFLTQAYIMLRLRKTSQSARSTQNSVGQPSEYEENGKNQDQKISRALRKFNALNEDYKVQLERHLIFTVGEEKNEKKKPSIRSNNFAIKANIQHLQNMVELSNLDLEAEKINHPGARRKSFGGIPGKKEKITGETYLEAYRKLQQGNGQENRCPTDGVYGFLSSKTLPFEPLKKFFKQPQQENTIASAAKRMINGRQAKPLDKVLDYAKRKIQDEIKKKTTQSIHHIADEDEQQDVTNLNNRIRSVNQLDFSYQIVVDNMINEKQERMCKILTRMNKRFEHILKKKDVLPNRIAQQKNLKTKEALPILHKEKIEQNRRPKSSIDVFGDKQNSILSFSRNKPSQFKGQNFIKHKNQGKRIRSASISIPNEKPEYQI